MANDDDVVHPGAFDVADERGDLVGDGHLPQVSGLVPPSWHVEIHQFRIEARQVGYRVSFEAPCCYTATTIGHGWFANFGQLPTLESATMLEYRALGVRFNHLQIERTGPSAYLVLLPGPTGFATSAGRTSFAAEARNSSAHLAVSFVRR